MKEEFLVRCHRFKGTWDSMYYWTKIATKVLKDNDLVEVDATTREGLVRILKRE